MTLPINARDVIKQLTGINRLTPVDYRPLGIVMAAYEGI